MPNLQLIVPLVLGLCFSMPMAVSLAPLLGDTPGLSRHCDHSRSMKKALLQLNLHGLVHELLDTPTLDAFVATHQPNPRDLAACAMQKSFQARGRLAAMLVLYKLSDTVYAKIPLETKAEVYCLALQKDVLEADDAWGSLWWESEVGLLGYHVLAQGDAAIPALVTMLDDESLRNRYHGDGEKTTLLAIRHYRVKDFAAYYIAKILAYDLPWQSVLADRDTAINQMQQDLGL
jgi:hypothetical protein